LQICGSGCAPRSPRPSRKPTSSCSPPCPGQQRHPHQRGVRGGRHFQGPHCPWIAVGKRNLRGDRQQAARSGQHLRVAKPAIQGACPGRRYCPCDRHGQRDDPSKISRLARHGLHGWRTGGDRGRGPGRTPCSLAPRISQSGRVRKKRLPLLRRSSTEAAAGQFNASRDTRGTGTAPTTISRRGQ
jgi:hypothetical protein